MASVLDTENRSAEYVSGLLSGNSVGLDLIFNERFHLRGIMYHVISITSNCWNTLRTEAYRYVYGSSFFPKNFRTKPDGERYRYTNTVP